jgi:hypothetical protein
MNRLDRYELLLDWDEHDSERNYFIAQWPVKQPENRYADYWVKHEEVVDLEEENQRLNKRVAELELENLILRNKEET